VGARHVSSALRASRKGCETGPEKDEPRIPVLRDVMKPGLPDSLGMLAREDLMIDKEDSRIAL
jgi:hypothetical protein